MCSRISEKHDQTSVFVEGVLWNHSCSSVHLSVHPLVTHFFSGSTEWIFLTHFSPVSHFYTPWKRQKTFGFLKESVAHKKLCSTIARVPHRRNLQQSASRIWICAKPCLYCSNVSHSVKKGIKSSPTIVHFK